MNLRHRAGLDRVLVAANAQWCLVASMTLLVVMAVGAEETAESRAFRTAAGAFQDGIYDRAERKFREFVTAFPQSPMLHEALLLQAQAALKQTNLTGAIALLNSHVTKAGLLTDQYRYWMATAHLQNNNFTAAADSFALIPRQFTNSPLLLEAGHGEALARFKLRDFSRVVTLLQDPNRAFQQAARSRPNDELTIRGQLLLAEALFEQKQYHAAEEAAARLSQKNLTPEYSWDRQYLVCRILVADQNLPEALAQTTNLIALAGETANRNLLADSVTMQAGILQRLNRLDEAIQAYTKNLADTVPSDRRRLALLNVIELKLAQNNIVEAENMLQAFLARHPDDAASDVVLLTSGELQLKLYLDQAATNRTEEASASIGATNRLEQALAQFEKIRVDSPFRGKALLNQGWCLWLYHRIPESAAAFRAATESLPFSDDLAVARFKLADALYVQGDYTNAVRVYRALIKEFVGMPRIRESLVDQALYQIVRASIELGDETAATNAMNQVLDLYPESSFTERSMWLVGQELIRIKQPSEARKVFHDFAKRFAGRPLLPKVELAIARTYFHESEWPSALSKYEEWMERYPTNDLLPRAQFNLAWANDKAGHKTNAFNLFTNFVAQFPTNELAPRAQYWVADEYYRRRNYVEAQRNYQKIPENTNWPTTALTYQARLRAGHSAFAAQLWKDAAGHFTLLINDRGCPDDMVAEAFYAYGDTMIEWNAEPAKPLQNYIEARKTFAKIPQLYPTSRLVPAAWGRIGDCCLQLASQDTKQYDKATDAYRMVFMPHSRADITVRSLAEFGLAHVLEVQASDKAFADNAATLKAAAFDHYYNIVIGQNLRDKEESDRFWLEKAGFAAARLAEERQQWSVAINIYQRLCRVEGLAPLQDRLKDRIKKAEEQSGNEKK